MTKPTEDQGIIGGHHWALRESFLSVSRAIADRDWIRAATELAQAEAHLTAIMTEDKGHE